MKTKNGIELDLKESNFLFTFYGAVFYFSSNLNLNRFKESLIDYIRFEEVKLYNKYKVKLDLKLYLAIALYDVDGRLTRISKIATTTDSTGEEKEISVSIIPETGDVKAKAFIWDGVTGMTPLAENASIGF